MRRAWIVIVALVASAALAEYRFTYTNPAVGKAGSPALLEYFSSTDCTACLRFERETLLSLRDLIDGGVLRVVFRDLPPPPPYMAIANDIFCAQEVPDYLSARVAYKQALADTRGFASQLSGLKKHRFLQCQHNLAAWPVFAHNQETFNELDFNGTPGFRLTVQRDGEPLVSNFTGPIEPTRLRGFIQGTHPSPITLTSMR